MIYEKYDGSDEQLLQLIYKYDPNMNMADRDYLISVDDREGVVKTLQAKLLEREHQELLNLEKLRQQNLYVDYGDEEYDTYQLDTSANFEKTAVDDRKKLGLVHSNNFMIDERNSSAGSNVSFDDQIYDSEFEHELQLFKKKLERRESSSENISRSRQRECKLIPNVSAEWIEQL